MTLIGRKGCGFLGTNALSSSKVIARFCWDGSSERIPNEGGPISKSAYLQVGGSGCQKISQSVCLRLLTNRILINCGESSDGYFKGIANSILITHLDWTKIGGLQPIIYKSASSQKEELFLCGPPGLDVFIYSSERFLRLRNIKVNVLDHDSISNFSFNNLSLSCIPIRDSNKTRYMPPSVDKSWTRNKFFYDREIASILKRTPKNKVDLNVSYSYICRTQSNKYWLLSECVKRGVKPGENMLKLWRGDSVVVEDGSVVNPEDVIKSDPYPNIIVIDCPTEGYLDDLLVKKSYDEFHQQLLIIIHFTPVPVMKDHRYVAWMRRFSPETKHIVVNESSMWTTPGKIANKQEVCRLINPRFFPKLNIPNQLKKQDPNPHWVEFGSFLLENQGCTALVEQSPCKRWLKTWTQLPKDLQLIQSWFGTVIDLAALTTERFSESFVISQLPPPNKSQEMHPSRYGPKNPQITFLGTASQGSATYRNTSCILIRISSNNAMLLDCGDGAMNQLASLYSEDELQSLLTSIRCIYISHPHADHHSGLMGVLLAINRAWAARRLTPVKLILFLPPPLMDWFQTYNDKFQPVFENVILFNLADLVSLIARDESVNLVLRSSGEAGEAEVEAEATCHNSPSKIHAFSKISSDYHTLKAYGKMFRATLEMNDMKICWAKHCAFSFCVSFEHINGWKISYSGDSQYNAAFAVIGKNCDLLIHEATYATGLKRMAKIAKHSTTGDAIRVGSEMNAKQVILTHFSRRYPVVPYLEDLKGTNNVSVAFDFMQVNLNDVHLLPKLNDSYKVVFEQYVSDVQEDHDRIVAKHQVLKNA